MFCVHFYFQNGKTALILAAERGYEILIFILLDGGAEINFKQAVPMLMHVTIE